MASEHLPALCGLRFISNCLNCPFSGQPAVIEPLGSGRIKVPLTPCLRVLLEYDRQSCRRLARVFPARFCGGSAAPCGYHSRSKARDFLRRRSGGIRGSLVCSPSGDHSCGDCKNFARTGCYLSRESRRQKEPPLKSVKRNEGKQRSVRAIMRLVWYVTAKSRSTTSNCCRDILLLQRNPWIRLRPDSARELSPRSGIQSSRRFRSWVVSIRESSRSRAASPPMTRWSNNMKGSPHSFPSTVTALPTWPSAPERRSD